MALIGTAGSLVLSSINLKTPSEKRAAAVMPQVVESALAGNLVAVRVLDERREAPTFSAPFGIAAERKVWSGGYQQVASAKPNIINDYARERQAGRVPIPDHQSPESAAGYALAHPYTSAGSTASVAPKVLTGELPERSPLDAALAPLREEAGQLNKAAADAVQRLAAGVGTAAGQAIDSTGNRLTIPTDTKTLGALAIGLGLVLVVGVVVARRA
jgi:hypothetical protein